MATISWAGGSGDWAAGSNWLGGSVPAVTDTAIITGSASETITVSTVQPVQTLLLDDPAADFLVSGTVTATGDIDVTANSVVVTGALISSGSIQIDAMSSIDLTEGFLQTGTATLQIGTVEVGPQPIIVAAGTISDVVLDGTTGGAEFVTTACFARGTRLLAGMRPVAVEDLRVGDTVDLADGGSASIAWIGRRRLDCRRHRNPHAIWPVRISAGAFSDGVPRRDLFLSPDHAVFWNGILVPVRYLVNEITIVQEPRQEVEYFHVELPLHDVVLAEGLPVESYLDRDGRRAFSGTVMDLHPSFAAWTWDARACAELVVTGPALQAVQCAIAERAAQLAALTPSPRRRPVR